MIKPYQPEDFACLSRFVAAIQEHERRAVPELKAGDEIAHSYADYLVKRVDADNGHIFMAHVDDKIIGMICSWVSRDEDQLLQDASKEHAYISDIYVEETYRGKGIAQKLLETTEAAFRAKGYERIRVCSKGTNIQALSFYKSSGYAPYEVIFSKLLSVRPKTC